jgi:hypothetical protein
MFRVHHDHSSTLIGALMAHPRAALTVLVMVPAAFDGTPLANVGANATDFVDKMRPTRHEISGEPAKLSTVLVELNTFGQHGRIGLTHACVSTIVAFRRAPAAGFHTGREVFRRHG